MKNFPSDANVFTETKCCTFKVALLCSTAAAKDSKMLT